MKKILRFFDKLEDFVRGKLSHYPIVYSLISATGIIIFWRAIWIIADSVHLSAIGSLIGSALVLLVSGLFVSFFVGDSILISGIRREKKMIEKTEDEIDMEQGTLRRIQGEISREESAMSQIRSELSELRRMLEEIKNKN